MANHIYKKAAEQTIKKAKQRLSTLLEEHIDEINKEEGIFTITVTCKDSSVIAKLSYTGFSEELSAKISSKLESSPS